MNQFDLLKKNLCRNDIRDAVEDDGMQDEPIVRLNSDITVQGTFHENSFESAIKRWSWECAIPKHADIMKLAVFSHFDEAQIHSIRVSIRSNCTCCLLEFSSLQQLQDFYIPQAALMYCSVTLEVISNAMPLNSGGTCTFQGFYVKRYTFETLVCVDGVFNHSELPITAPCFWPAGDKRLFCTHAGRAFNVPQLV